MAREDGRRRGRLRPGPGQVPLEQLQKKRKNLNRMAAEDLVSWEDFKELRTEIEGEEATLNSRIQMVLQHQALLSADFELALDIACNLGWLYGKGSFDERRLLVETLFKRVDAQGDMVVAYELNPPFTMFCPGPDKNENGPDGDPSGPVRVMSALVAQSERMCEPNESWLRRLVGLLAA